MFATIADEKTRWDSRKAQAQVHVAELARRQEELTGELSAAELVPQQISDSPRGTSSNPGIKPSRSRGGWRICWP